MRACDVAALATDATGWGRDVIEVVQQKTGAPLELPLLPQVGNAIYDYVTGERCVSRDPTCSCRRGGRTGGPARTP
jgi:hypothetical protein